MSANVTQLDHLNLSVRDFDETAAWYGRVFDFTIVEQGVQDGVTWGVLRAGDAMLCIYEHPSRPAPDRYDEARQHINHFGLRITDREAWEATIEREQLEVNYGGVVNWPHSTAWYVSDPTGYEIEVALWADDTIAFEPLMR